jgi:hypothetical protein
MISRTAIGESDWYVVSIDVTKQSIVQLEKRLARAAEVLEQARRQRLAGTTIIDLVEQFRAAGASDARLAAYRAIHDFEQAVTGYRAAVVQALVDDEHMTFTQVGDLLGVSRQMVARLYRNIRGVRSGDRSESKPDG